MAEDGAGRGAGLGRSVGKASPIGGRGRRVKRIVRRDPGKTVVRGTKRTDCYLNLGVGDIDVGEGREELMQQRASLVAAAGVVRSEEGEQIAFGLVGNHFDEVGQVFTFGGQLDHGPVAEVADFHPLWECSTAGEKLSESFPCVPKLLFYLAVGDLETAHSRLALLRAVRHRCAVGLLQLGRRCPSVADVVVECASLGIGYGAGWVVGLHLVVSECVEQELFA